MTIALSLACLRTALEMISLATEEAVTRRLVGRAIELVDGAAGEVLEERAKDAARKPPRGSGFPRKSAEAPLPSLSLFSEDPNSQEREKETGPPPAPPPPAPAAPPAPEVVEVLRADTPLTAARERVAEEARVADPPTCWRKFALLKAALRGASIDRAWALWCLNEKQRAPPSSESRLKVAERWRARDEQDAEYRKTAGPAPAALRELVAGLAKGRAPPPASLAQGA